MVDVLCIKYIETQTILSVNYQITIILVDAMASYRILAEKRFLFLTLWILVGFSCGFNVTSYCHTENFDQNFGLPGCAPAYTINKRCAGVCPHLFIPNTGNQPVPYDTCAMCKPVINRVTVIYKCKGKSHYFQFDMVTDCSCKPVDCRCSTKLPADGKKVHQ